MIPFQHPAGVVISGSSGCGKTELCYRLIKQKDDMFEPKINRVVWYFSVWQPYYKVMANEYGVKFIQGLPDVSEYDGTFNTLMVIDDMMSENKGTLIADIFTKHSHHRSLSVLFLVQNLFHKNIREISLNAKYLILFKQIRDKMQINCLAKQMAPGNSRFVLESYEDATREAYSFVLFDMTQSCPEEWRIRTNIFPGERIVVYVPKTI